MRIVDLSLPIDFEHVRWQAERWVKGDLAAGSIDQVTTIKLSCHSFTHVDARRHYFLDGATIEATPLEDVVGPADVIDLMDVAANEAIDAPRLAPRLAGLPAGARVILKTAWHRHRSFRTREFWLDAPYLTREAALALKAARIRTIAYDFPQDFPIRLLLSGETRPIEEHVTHDILLRAGVHMIEYLTNTAALVEKRVLLSAAPLKVPAADGAPARVYAIEGLALG
jgi:kynurenine formamidase